MNARKLFARVVRIPSLSILLLSVVACSPSREELQGQLDDTRSQLAGLQSARQKSEASMQAKITELQEELAQGDAQIDKLRSEGDDMLAQLAELEDEQARRRSELATYEDLFARLEGLITAGTVRVTFRKGRMNVELASEVLFDTGKTALKPNGQVALDQLIEVFASVAHRDLMVGGHTDNVPIQTRRYQSNWELSTQRAVVVVNYMVGHEFPPDHLFAAGFGEYDPVDDNDTEDGRRHNRRIEIVLMPDLGELAGISTMAQNAD